MLHGVTVYGVGGREFSLYTGKSFLNARNQCTTAGSVCSDKVAISKGVSQGSILGLLWFLIFIKDFPIRLRLTQSNQFADDTIIYAQGNRR